MKLDPHHWSFGCPLAAALCITLGSACASKNSAAPMAPSSVQQGQLYQTGHSEFDGLFRELHGLQQSLAAAADEERQYRRALASALQLENGATRQALADNIQVTAAALEKKKVRVRLEIEGLDADDESDTLAQAKVSGSLDDDSQRFIEATAMAARQELRFAARLRRAQKRLEHLAHHASALDPWVETTFAGQGTPKVTEVHRNLDDARRQFPLLTVRASELALESRRTVQRLAQALTTDPGLGNGKEPPLIAPMDGATKPRLQHSGAAKRPPVAPAAAPKPASPPATPGGDFEP